MKIYPSKHSVISTKKIDRNFDIPLAYINSDNFNLKVEILYSHSEHNKRIVLPYEYFDDLDVIFFDENGEEVNTLDILRRDDKNKKYYYIPKHSTAYEPQRFNYEILAQKSLKYSPSELYNIEVSCTDLDFAKKIIQIFGDAPKRNLCPSNININNQNKIPMAFLNDRIKGDIIFILSDDGIHYKGTDTVIDFSRYLNNHVNVWLITNSLENQKMLTNLKPKHYRLTNTILYNSIEKVGAINVLNDDLLKSTDLYKNLENPQCINLFDSSNYPIGIIKEDKKGMIVCSNTEIFENLDKNKNTIYDVIMYVYCNSYIKSKPINTWITDEAPDYVIENGHIFKKEKITNQINVSKIFSIKKEEINICDIIIDAPNIFIDDITNDFVVFKKNMDSKYDSYKDGFHKPPGSKTVYTLRQNIMCYEDFLYLITDNLKDKISYIIKDKKVFLKVEPFKDSINGVNIKDPSFFELSMTTIKNYKEINLDSVEYYLCCKDNVLNTINKTLYNKYDNGKILAEIRIEKEKSQPNIFDIRQRGGGSDDKEINYDLLDVGNVLGRPYRKAGAIIVTMPKKYEKYKDIIEETIEKHKIAEEYFVLLFED